MTLNLLYLEQPNDDADKQLFCYVKIRIYFLSCVRLELCRHFNIIDLLHPCSFSRFACTVEMEICEHHPKHTACIFCETQIAHLLKNPIAYNVFFFDFVTRFYLSPILFGALQSPSNPNSNVHVHVFSLLLLEAKCMKKVIKTTTTTTNKN